jgi:hypothetical protein
VHNALEPAQVSVWISQVGRDFGPFPGSP